MILVKVAICSLGCKVNIYESEYVISKLKENGRKKKLDEDELEAVIFSASLSVNKFTAQILGEIVNQENTKIYQ